jgi:hypothetical protein
MFSPSFKVEREVYEFQLSFYCLINFLDLDKYQTTGL